MNDATLTFSVDPELKQNAIRNAESIGIPLPFLMNAFLVRFVAEGRLPFDLSVPEIPNAVTLASLEETRKGEGLNEYANVHDMAKDLGL